MDRREDQAESALRFHSLVMNGGALHALAVVRASLDDLRAAFEMLDLGPGVALLDEAARLLPRDDGTDETARGLVERLSDEDARQLEILGDRYSSEVDDAALAAAISAHLRVRRRPSLPRPVAEMIREYLEALEEQERDLSAQRIAAANRLAKRAWDLAAQLRRSPEGREAIWQQRSHPSQRVRVTVLTHSLGARDPEAEALLDAEAASSFEARMVVREWRAGRLRLPA